MRTDHIGLRATSNCWICEGWSQVRFRFVPRQSSEDILDQFSVVNLHLECDDFEAESMRKEANSDEYISVRMVPPGRMR